ncbi:hypothetical protein [Kamptonema formosum]|nr:hypothetical protein [Oscillatoria sp. PCC 10802]
MDGLAAVSKQEQFPIKGFGSREKMQKVGSGYIFIHRLLLEHFAQMSLK